MFWSSRRIAEHREAPRFLPRLEPLEERVTLSLGPEFAVSTTGNNRSADNASSANGNSVVVWVSDDGNATTSAGQSSPIQYRLYDAAGQRIGFLRSIESQRNNSEPAVGMDASGGFVVAWTRTLSNGNSDVLASRFDAQANRVGGVISVATTAKGESEPTVAVAANGDFVVAYTLQTASNNTDVVAKMYGKSTLPTRTINVGRSSINERQPSAASAPDGRFVVAFQRDDKSSNPDILLGRYSARGDLLGLSAMANSSRAERTPDVDVDNQGNAVVAWSEIRSDNVLGVFARRVNAAGTAGPRLIIRESSEPSVLPSVALRRSNGSFVVAYDVTTSGPETRVFLTEVSAADVLRPVINAGVGRQGAALSVNGDNRIFLTETARTNRPNQTDIRGRFGTFT